MSQYTDLDNIANSLDFTASGDLSGSSSAQTVVGLQNNPLSNTSPTLNQVLAWNGSVWIPTSPGSGSFSAGGDLSGTDSNQTVIGLQGTALGASVGTVGAAEDGYALAWNNSFSEWQPIYVNAPDLSSYALKAITISAGTGLTGGGDLSANRTLSVDFGNSATTVCVGNDSRLTDSRAPTGSAGGDLSATYPNPTVNKIQGVLVNATPPTDGQVLTYDNDDGYWKPADAAISFTAGGDLSGNNSSQTVIAIQGNSVDNAALGSDEDGYVLTWINGTSEWTATPLPSVITSLPLTGDVSGTTDANTVDSIKGKSLSSNVGTVGATEDGYALVWNNGTSEWIPSDVSTDLSGYVPNSRTVSAGTGLTGGGDLSANITLSVSFGSSAGTVCEGNDSRLSDSRTPSGSAGGDLSSSYPNPTVAKIQGVSVNSTAPTDGQVLTYDNDDGYWKPATPTVVTSLAMTGDVSGTTDSNTVDKIKGKNLDSDLSTIGASEDGYVLTWTNGSSEWQAKPIVSTGGFSPPITLTHVTKTSNYTITTSDYVILCDTSGGAFTLTLPTVVSGQSFIIKDKVGTFETNNLTLARAGSEKIEGVAANRLLTANFGSYHIFNNGTDWILL